MINIVLWVLQVALAGLCVSGGYFQMFKVPQLRAHSASMRELPRAFWAVVGAIGFCAGLALIIPGLLHLAPLLTADAAIIVTVESIVLVVCFVRYRDRASIPYSVTMGIMAAIIAYGRFVVRPL